jgi:signal transduction histidine kinase
VSLTVIALMTATMWWAFWAETVSELQSHVEGEADRIATQLRSHVATGDADSTQIHPSQLGGSLPVDHRIEMTWSDGHHVTVGPPGGGPSSTEQVAEGVTISVVDASGDLQRQLWAGAAVIGGVALALVGLATVIAVRTSRRLTEPISDLAEQAQRLGAGDLRAAGHHYGIPELDQLADSLDAATRLVAELLAEERSLTLDASHQLKTPLTALSLRLEELADSPVDPAVVSEAVAALEQVERLSAVVDGLLRDRRARSTHQRRVSLRDVVEQQLTEWRPAYDAAGRALSSTVDIEGAVLVERGPVGQVVASLVENSLLHGAGRTTVEAKAAPGTAWVEVFDEGEGISDELAPQVFERDISGSGGTGLGLAAAQDAAVSIGGRIALVRRRPAHFRLFLDSRENPATVCPEAEQGAQPNSDDVGGDVVGQG